MLSKLFCPRSFYVKCWSYKKKSPSFFQVNCCLFRVKTLNINVKNLMGNEFDPHWEGEKWKFDKLKHFCSSDVLTINKINRSFAVIFKIFVQKRHTLLFRLFLIPSRTPLRFKFDVIYECPGTSSNFLLLYSYIWTFKKRNFNHFTLIISWIIITINS